MDAQTQQLQAILQRYFDPAGSAESKLELEGLLTQFKFRPDAWRLGVYVLQRASQGANDQGPYLLWFAASLLDDAVRRGWGSIDENNKAGLRAGIFHFLLHHTTALPAFVANKLATVSANIARLDWPHRQPQFLHDLEGSLQQRGTRPGSLLLLSAAIEQMEAVFPDQPSREVGQVLWSRGQELSALLRPAYPGILQALCAALRDEVNAGSAAPQTLAVLEALKRILGGSKGNQGQALQVAAGGQQTEGLLSTLAHIAFASQGVSGNDSGEAIAAMECLTLIAGATVPPAASAALFPLLLMHLQALCDVAGAAVGAERLSDEWWLAAVRLTATFLKRHMTAIDRSPEQQGPFDQLLQKLATMTFASRTARHVAVSCEVWRSVSDVLSEQQDALWEAPDPDSAQAAWEQKVAPLRSGLLGIADTLLVSMLYTMQPQQSCAAPSATELDTSSGSGAELEEVVEAAGASQGTTADDEDAEHSDEGRMLAGEAPSEAEVYISQCEAFVGQLIGIFPREMVPRIVERYSSCLGAVQSQEAAANGAGMRAALWDLATCLKLMSRCSCHMPREGPHASAASQAVYQTLQFASGWADLRPTAIRLCGQGSEIDIVGTLTCKLLAAFAAVWLPLQSSDVIVQTADGCLQCAMRAVQCATEANPTQGAPAPPPLLLTAAFEMLAVLCSILLSAQGPASGWLSEEKLSPLIRAAPGLLLGKLSPSGPSAGKGAGRAGQALYTALSDALLRSDGAGDPAALQRRASAVLQPLTDIIDGAVSGGTPAEVIEQVTPVLAAVIGRLKTASKNVRTIVFQGCIVGTVHASVTLLRRCQEVMVSSSLTDAAAASPAERMAQSLNRLMATVVDTFGPEIGDNGLEALLKTSLEIHSMEGAQGVDGWALLHSGRHSDALLQLLAQCASTRGCPALLVTATLGFFFALWDQVVGGSGAEAEEGDGGRVSGKSHGKGLKDLATDRGCLGAQILCKTCLILEANWRRFVGRVDGGGGGVAAAAAAMAARQGHNAASAYAADAQHFAAQRHEEEAGQAVGPDAPLRMLAMATEFFEHAASQCHVAPSPGDVKLVLESILDLEDAVQLSKAPQLTPAFPGLLASLMNLLHDSGRLSSLQDDIIGVLYLLASADWTTFASFFRNYVDELSEVQNANEQQSERRATLLQSLEGAADELDFARGVARFLNDSKHFQGLSRVV